MKNLQKFKEYFKKYKKIYSKLIPDYIKKECKVVNKVYFISDLHIGHTSLNKNLRNMSNEEVWEKIKKNWNKKVKSPKDIVYILGDVTMSNPKELDKLLQLNGQKIIICGNHDTVKTYWKLRRLGIVTLGCLNYKDYMCTHIPIHPSEVAYFKGNIHGHIHDHELKNYKYINVCLELNNYTPLTFKEVLDKQNKKLPFYIKILKFFRKYGSKN